MEQGQGTFNPSFIFISIFDKKRKVKLKTQNKKTKINKNEKHHCNLLFLHSLFVTIIKMSLGNMCSKKYSKDNSEQFGNVPRKGNYILPKNIKYNQNNSLKENLK